MQLSILRRQRCARTSALISVSSRLGFRAGAATPSGVTNRLRPPRRCSRIGMRMVELAATPAPDAAARELAEVLAVRQGE